MTYKPKTRFSAKMCVRALYAQHSSWAALADALKEYGIDRDRSYWRKVATGERRMSTNDENALRFCVGLPPRGCSQIAKMPTDVLARCLRERIEIP